MADDLPPAEGPPAPEPPLDRHAVQAQARASKKSARRKWPKRLAITLGVVVLLAVGVGVGAYVYAGYRFHQIKKVHIKHLTKQTTTPAAPFNVLLVGSDTRSFVTNATQQKAFGDEAAGARSDVTMVARFVPATKQIYILSIPRDTSVTIPGDISGISGQNRINAAFNNGPDLLIQTIQQNFGISINHYASVNFNGFQGMVDALGGVTMDFSTPVKDSYSGLNVTTTGCQIVPGTTSLELVRARHLYYQKDGEWVYDGLSDFSRIQRQDAFFQAVLQKVGAEDTNPIALNGFIGAAVTNLTIDDTVTEGQLITLARQFHGITSADLHTETLPTTSYVTSGGADELQVAQPYANQMIAAFLAEGTTPTPASTTTTTSKSAGPSKSTSTSTSTAPTTTTTTTPPPSSVEVRVLNGRGVAGVAASTASKLTSAGFKVVSTGDAPNFNYTASQIQYGPDGAAAAATLAAHVEGSVTLVPDSSLTGSEVNLIIGSDLEGISATASSTTTTTGGATTSTSTSTTTTTPSSTPTTIPGDVYTNTQQEPWNPTPCTL